MVGAKGQGGTYANRQKGQSLTQRTQLQSCLEGHAVPERAVSQQTVWQLLVDLPSQDPAAGGRSVRVAASWALGCLLLATDLQGWISGPWSSPCIQQLPLCCHQAGAVWEVPGNFRSGVYGPGNRLVSLTYWIGGRIFSNGLPKSRTTLKNSLEFQLMEVLGWRTEYYRWKICIPYTSFQWSHLVCVRSCFFTLPLLGFGLIHTFRQKLWLHVVKKEKTKR